MMADDRTSNPGCLLFFLGLFRSGGKKAEGLPYRMRPDLLSKAELSFYHALRGAIGERAVVCCKVGLNDLFSVPNIPGAVAHRNRIERKHVDFVICHPATMKPIVAIELDDSSHARPDRVKRDAFVDEVFAAAGLPLLHVTNKRGYTMPELRELLTLHLPE